MKPSNDVGGHERVDHRSYARQGLDRKPGQHFGPAAAHMVARGLDHDRLSEAAAMAERQDDQRAIEHEADVLTGGGRGAVTHDDEPSKRRRDHDSTAPDRNADLFPGRRGILSASRAKHLRNSPWAITLTPSRLSKDYAVPPISTVIPTPRDRKTALDARLSPLREFGL